MLCRNRTKHQKVVDLHDLVYSAPQEESNFFVFTCFFDKRHAYLLGNTKYQNNSNKLTDSFEIQLIMSIQYTLYRASDITQN